MNTYDLFSMKGKTVLITGGRAMYGKGATLALADAGADIFLASHSIESAADFAASLSAEKGVRVTPVAFDLNDPESCAALVKTVLDKAGRIDAFVHCSRILPSAGRVKYGTGSGWDQSPEQLEANVRVNSAASLYLLSLVGRQMIAQRSGSIVVFGSMMGLIGVEKHNYDGNPQMIPGATAMPTPWTSRGFPPGCAMPRASTGSTACVSTPYAPAA